VAITQILPTSLAMTLDSMAYLKNNDGNALSIYLLIGYSHSDPLYLYYKHVYLSHGQGLQNGHGSKAETHPGGGGEMHPGTAVANLVWTRKTRLNRSSLF
jgi:hypothetical protein